jgi:hypothetical protein
MRKIGVALVICLLLVFFMGAQTVSALKAPTMTGTGSMFDLSKSKVALKNIEKKLMTGSTAGIAAAQNSMDAQTRLLADGIYADTNAVFKAKKNNTTPTVTVKAPKTTITKPMTNLQDTAKGLEKLDFSAPSLKKAILVVF